MKKPTYADHRRADEVSGAHADARALRCQARGCPRAWTINNGSSRLCSAHAGRLPEDWPAITERLVWEETERARQAAALPRQGTLLRHYPVPPSPERLAHLKRWADMHRRGDPPARRRRGEGSAW